MSASCGRFSHLQGIDQRLWVRANASQANRRGLIEDWSAIGVEALSTEAVLSEGCGSSFPAKKVHDLAQWKLQCELLRASNVVDYEVGWHPSGCLRLTKKLHVRLGCANLRSQLQVGREVRCRTGHCDFRIHTTTRQNSEADHWVGFWL